MEVQLIQIGLAFIEGFALIISPCILPILPIMLSGSLTGSKSRPLGIITGFIVLFTLFTLFSRSILQLLPFGQDILRDISFALLILLGIIMVSDYLTEKFSLLSNRLLSVGSSLQIANDREGGFYSGLLFGSLVALIWTPCAGPILAAVIVQVVIQQTTFSSILTIVAFAIGAGLPMLLMALLGRSVLSYFQIFKRHTKLIRKLLGFIIIISVIAILYVPENVLVTVNNTTNTTEEKAGLIDGLLRPYPAPEFAGITAWINTAPLSMKQLKGKVVLIDFWTYSCINCIRTLPFLKAWYKKYHADGFEIIGIHSPEFQFEQDLENVKNAVNKFGIRYPVALDNIFKTWQNYHNRYWPAHYLINKEGIVVYQHFGEGEYDTTENNIRYLLNKKAMPLVDNTSYFSFAVTPETYFGYERAENFVSKEYMSRNESFFYTYPDGFAENDWALQGNWTVYADKIVANSAGASIKIRFRAANVYAVMGSTKPVTVKVRFNDNEKAPAGVDVKDNRINVDENRLYSIIHAKEQTQGYLELTAESAGLEMYTFTFG